MHMKDTRMPTSFNYTFIVEVYANPNPCMVSTLLFGQTNNLFCLEVIEVTSIMLHLFNGPELASKDANSKLVEAVTVAVIDDEKCFDDGFTQIWKLKFGHKAKFCSDFERKVWSRV